MALPRYRPLRFVTLLPAFAAALAGCSAGEQIHPYSAMRTEQAKERAQRDARQARHYANEVRANNDTLASLLEELGRRADLAERQLQECEEKVRSQGVLVPPRPAQSIPPRLP